MFLKFQKVTEFDYNFTQQHGWILQNVEQQQQKSQTQKRKEYMSC